jgi:cytochrome c-type biogenesis protein CcmH/NrfF
VRRALALAGIVLATLASAFLAHGVLAGEGAPEHGWTLAQIEPELWCPTCKLRLDLSHSQEADRIRSIVVSKQALGWSKSRLESYLQAQFPGQQVLAETPRSGFGLLAWLVPGAVLVGGALLAGWLARSWSGGGSEGGRGEPPPLSASDEARLQRVLDAELEHGA